MPELYINMRPCDTLSIERVVICKSALPWTGGVKLGKQDRERVREGWEEKEGRTDSWTQRVNDRDECEREGGKRV